jgi:hypothetical protein
MANYRWYSIGVIIIERKEMKKSELKNIIKECVKEVIFEEGVLSGIISEVAQGLQGVSLVQESAPTPQPQQRRVSETKKQVLSAIGNNGYDDIKKRFSNPALFEGTAPIPGDSKGPLAGVAGSDPGVDISNLPGMGNWGAVASGKRK